ncbi:MAG TPA: NAD(P)-dependent oxidoreductase [Pirellulales bacterium]|jgi:nucleoside-diphosphate-sugar epimerase|nr:NAD(P)-dependent oxidoreductase [Pirellulales bacterium]
MKRQTIFVTGGYGCIGAETSKWLLRNSDASVVVCSRSVSDQRSQRVFYDVHCERLIEVQADVTDQRALEDILSRHQVTRVVHLAALQTPDCNAHRNLGLQINVAGTLNVVEAMKASGLPLERFIFASSIAVYGPRSSYPAGRVPMLAEPNPVNVYGVWKLAGEQISKLFCKETGVPTLSLRPGVLYGPGRDAGLTSSPTTAMKHLALGRAYEIPFRSRQDYLFAPDVGGAIGTAVLERFDGYGAFTLPSLTVSTDEIVAGMRRAAAGMGLADRFQITVGSEDVPFICDLEYEPFVEAFPNVPHTPLDEGVRRSLAVFLDHARRGWIGN